MSKLSILVVEDDALIGAVLAEMLVGLGYHVGMVQATEEGAVAAAARQRPDLMIVDLQLAKGSGAAVVERITRAGPIPHVFMSGLGLFAEGHGGGVLLTKPFREADLTGAIARAFDQAASAANGLS